MFLSIRVAPSLFLRALSSLSILQWDFSASKSSLVRLFTAGIKLNGPGTVVNNRAVTEIQFHNSCSFLPAQWCVSDSKYHGSVHQSRCVSRSGLRQACVGQSNTLEENISSVSTFTEDKASSNICSFVNHPQNQQHHAYYENWCSCRFVRTTNLALLSTFCLVICVTTESRMKYDIDIVKQLQMHVGLGSAETIN